MKSFHKDDLGIGRINQTTMAEAVELKLREYLKQKSFKPRKLITK
jgi:hypothetical protein